MKFTNSAGQTISFAQAAFAFTVQLALGAVILGTMYAGAVLAFCM